MNSDELQGKWKQLKGAAREQFGRLTDDDLEMIAGQRDRLVGKLQERYGYLREEAQKKADEWMASAKMSGATAGEKQQMPPPRTAGEQHAHKR